MPTFFAQICFFSYSLKVSFLDKLKKQSNVVFHRFSQVDNKSKKKVQNVDEAICSTTLLIKLSNVKNINEIDSLKANTNHSILAEPKVKMVDNNCQHSTFDMVSIQQPTNLITQKAGLLTDVKIQNSNIPVLCRKGNARITNPNCTRFNIDSMSALCQGFTQNKFDDNNANRKAKINEPLTFVIKNNRYAERKYKRFQSSRYAVSTLASLAKSGKKKNSATKTWYTEKKKSNGNDSKKMSKSISFVETDINSVASGDTSILTSQTTISSTITLPKSNIILAQLNQDSKALYKEKVKHAVSTKANSSDGNHSLCNQSQISNTLLTNTSHQSFTEQLSDTNTVSFDSYGDDTSFYTVRSPSVIGGQCDTHNSGQSGNLKIFLIRKNMKMMNAKNMKTIARKRPSSSAFRFWWKKNIDGFYY